MRRTQMFLLTVMSVVLSLLFSVAWLGGERSAYAQQPLPEEQAVVPSAGTAFTYQGRLLHDGQPVDGAICRFVFTLWDAETGGNSLATQDVVTTLEDGYFTVELDFGQDVFSGDPRWMSVGVRCPDPQGPWQQLEGRIPLRPAPYALTAMRLAPGTVLDGGGPTQSTLTVKNGDNIVAELGFPGLFGIGGTAVRGTSSIGHGVWGETQANNVGTAGVLGQSATDGLTYGVYGVHRGTRGAAVYGEAKNSEGRNVAGVYGKSTAASTGTGVRGEGTYAGIMGHGVGTEGFTFGVVGVTSSTARYSAGVYAENSAESGEGFGLHAVSKSPDGYAIYAENLSKTGTVMYAINHDRGRGIHVKVVGDAPDIPILNSGGPALLAEAPETAVFAATHGFGNDGAAVVATDTFRGNGYGRNVRLAYVGGSEGAPIAIGVWDDGLLWKVDWRGNVMARGTYSTINADFAELFPAGETLEPGDVLVIGPDGKLHRSTEPYQATVVGVYSTSPGFVGGDTGEDDENRIPLAVVGIVPVKASAENGPIRPGDLLVASSTPGHAMRCEGVEKCFGRVIGKALEGLEEGTGVIQMLVMLQ